MDTHIKKIFRMINNEVIDKIISYENGEMSEKDEHQFFQEIINSGLVYQLQGFYGRRAEELVSQGICKPNTKKE